MNVPISIGPVSSASALAWARTAGATLEAVRRHPEFEVPPDVVEEFDRYVREWTAIAEASEEFHWVGHIDPTLARRLAAYWVRLVTIARERPPAETGIAPAPPEAQPFFEALAGAMATAAAVEDEEAFTPLFEQGVPAFDERRPPDSAGAGGTRVLIVDDNDDMRVLLRSVLEFDPEFAVVGEAANGAEALEVVRGACPDAVVLDHMMPVMDGLTALPQLLDLCPAARVVMLTSVATDALVSSARECGAADVLSKSVPFDVLKRTLRDS